MTTRTGIVGHVLTGSASFQRLNAHLLRPAPATIVKSPKTEVWRAKRIRQQSGDGMNKWERQWLAHITPFHEHIHREVSLPLANGLRYKLDFLCVDKLGVIVGYEIKGRHMPAGIAKLKMAARLYPWIKFHLVYKVDGEWDVEDVRS